MIQRVYVSSTLLAWLIWWPKIDLTLLTALFFDECPYSFYHLQDRFDEMFIHWHAYKTGISFEAVEWVAIRPRHMINGRLAEWLGRGLQSLLRRFEPVRDLQSAPRRGL